jgi:hypothetical protein
VSDTSIDVSFKTLLISDNIADFYRYTVQYRYYNDTVGGYHNNVTVQHNAIGVIQVTIDGLQSGSTYVVRVLPLRMDLANDLLASGFPTSEIVADTATAPPSSGASTTTVVASVIGLIIGLTLIVAAALLVYIKYPKYQKVDVLKQKAENRYKQAEDVTDDDSGQQATNCTPARTTDHGDAMKSESLD